MTSTQERTPRKSPSRKKHFIGKGDIFGQNKTQQSILKYFTLKVKSEVTNEGSKARKQLFIDASDKKVTSLLVMEPIVISDDESFDQRKVESYLPKIKGKTATSGLKTFQASNIKGPTGKRPVVSPLNTKIEVADHVLKMINPSNRCLSLSTKSLKRKSSDYSDRSNNSDQVDPDLLENSPPELSSCCKVSPNKKLKSTHPSELSTKPEKSLDYESDDQVVSQMFINSPLIDKRVTCKSASPLQTRNVNNPSQATFLEATKDLKDPIHSENPIKKDPKREVLEQSATISSISTTNTQSFQKTDEKMCNIIIVKTESLLKKSIKAELDSVQQETAILADIDWSEPMEEQTNQPLPSPPSTPSKFDSPRKFQPPAIEGDLEPNALTAALTPTKSVNRSEPVSIFQSSHGACTPTKLSPTGQVQSPATIDAILNTPTKLVQSSSKSPIKFRSPLKRSPLKNKSPLKYDSEALSGNLALEHAISECWRFAQMSFQLNPANRKVADNFLGLGLPEKILLHHLLMRKWSWIRDTEMKYDKILTSKIGSLNALCEKGFIEDVNCGVELEVILDKLRLPELAELCKSHKLPSNGTKRELIGHLLKFSNFQGGLGFTLKNVKTAMKERALGVVGKCVRLTEHSRNSLQQIFEASMSPVYLEGKFYTFQERLRGLESLMNDIKFNGKKLIPFMLSDTQLFLNSVQFDEYISSTILKFKILSAKEKKNTEQGVELARDARSSLMIYLSSEVVREFLNKLPQYLWKFTAGSNYASTLDVGVEFFKKAKDYDSAVVSLNILLGQGIYRKHCRGHWYAEILLIMDRHLKNSAAEMYPVLMKGLEDDLTPIGRLELSKKAEMILNKKKGSLSVEQKAEARKLMRFPLLNHKVKEIKGNEAPNVSGGTRQTYVEVSMSGDRVYSNVEQTAKNSYTDEYPQGLHDEGAFLKNIILAVFWPVIYMPVDHMFVSKYQSQPLDWGTQAFYRNRKDKIEAHIAQLKSVGIDGVMQQITDVATVYLNHHSLINWFYINLDMLPDIKNILTCLTLKKFFDLADYLLKSFRERRSGWPDLMLWNAVAGTFKLVEVKSPNDELSVKQIVWLEKFVELGIDVEECRVNPTNKGKRRKVQTSEVMSEASQEVM